MFYQLDWDTEFFGVKCGRLLVDDVSELSDVKDEDFQKYDFTSIYNVNNEPTVNKWIGENTIAFLVDVNVQLEKKALSARDEADAEIIIENATEIDKETVDQMSVERDDFKYSKFVRDEKLSERDGYCVYKEWLKNSLKAEHKYFAYYPSGDTVGGYILFSVNEEDKAVTIELAKVNENLRGRRVATRMLDAVERFAVLEGYRKLRVGTQMNNIPAINLYHSRGYKETSRTSVFHLWNI
ncbi:MAG: GNAT family N-acetyltransferase [Mogibacterium sp.]|nr:GNAT family N-acetyltransferase [Mogibacterium sp.]